MVTQWQPQTDGEIIYPDSDGLPMSDNTIQFRWITVIYYNLAWLFAEDNNVFVAGDLLWYPVQGNNKSQRAKRLEQLLREAGIDPDRNP